MELSEGFPRKEPALRDRQPRPWLAYTNLAGCILLWASIPIASKKILAELDNLQMLFYSTLLSFLCLGAILLVQGQGKAFRQYSRNDYLTMGFLGFLGTYLYYVLLYGAFALTSASDAFILAYTWPILVILLAAILLHERLTWKNLLAVGVSFCSIVLIVTHGRVFSLASSNLQGNVLAFGGALVFALFSVLGKKFHFDHTISAFVFFAASLVLVTPTLALFSCFALPSATVCCWLLYNGILVNGITYIFWFKALEHGDTRIVSTLLYLTPAVSLVYVYFLLDERILPSSLAGLVVIVAGILFQSFSRK